VVHEPARASNVFLLTPEMRIPERRTPMPEVEATKRKVMSTNTSETGTDVLAQLAGAILDRRDIAIGARDVTLESMVREMLRPLLKEWLDRNLPYLIERLVKREIDLMVNRAERLED
jgi:cell pole-organizing protein PopZ